ncbi:hypothetical protein JTB14_036005 [Gonioctena quinquepunctata]|nr:hypothetical protein JTB14_036005 [Gonioctena quinquepunctata]
MNFFGGSGFLYSGSANFKREEIKVQAKAVSISTRNPSKETDYGNREKSSTRKRLGNPDKMRNRKFNLDFRSVWYDDSSRDEENATKSSTMVSQGYRLRKSSSLDSLLEPYTGKGRGRLLTKEMISAPRSPRRFENWSDIVKLGKDMQESNSAVKQADQIQRIVEENEVHDLEEKGNKITSENTNIKSDKSPSASETVNSENGMAETVFSKTIDMFVMGEEKYNSNDEPIREGDDEECLNEIETSTESDTQNDIIVKNDGNAQTLSDEIMEEIILRHKNPTPSSNQTEFIDEVNGKSDIFSDDNYETVIDVLKVNTLDRYRRKNILKTQLSFTPTNTQIENIVQEKDEESFASGKDEQDAVDSVNISVFMRSNDKIKRKNFKKEDISSPVGFLRIEHVRNVNMELASVENVSPNLSAMKFLSKSTDVSNFIINHFTCLFVELSQ